jgi:hypothetical protein
MSCYDTLAFREWLEALRDALDVPEPASHADDDTERRLLEYRAQCARISINSLLNAACDNCALRVETTALQNSTAARPAYPSLPRLVAS